MRTFLAGTVLTLGAVLGGVLVAPEQAPAAATPTDAATASAWGTDLGSAVGTGEAADPADSGDGAEAEALGYRFVSAPDLLNSDIGNLRGLPRYRAGQPNSINGRFRTALDLVHDSIAAERPGDVLVAGDLVEGHWTRDRTGRGYFGARRGAPLIRAAGQLYYAQWRKRFASRGLTVHTAVGDHEIGDNPWQRRGNLDQRLKWQNFGVFKDVYARQMVDPMGYSSRPRGQASRTAYATRLTPDVQLVTLDVFRRTDSDVVPQLDAAQVRWLNQVLAKANRDGVRWIVVQGHVPVLTPVRQRSSSGLSYRGGTDSALWRTMRRHGVDLYLSGEVHDVTVKRQGGITQISHGGIFGPLTNYLVGDVTGSTMRLRIKEFSGTRSSRDGDLWALDPRKAQPRILEMEPAETTGSLVLGADQRLISSEGRLAPGLARN